MHLVFRWTLSSLHAARGKRKRPARDSRSTRFQRPSSTAFPGRSAEFFCDRCRAAKAGVIAATKSYARLLAKEGVTVNAISPALIGTEMVAGNPHIKPDMIPVGRFGRVEECADVAVMLARNAYVTGQTISVNGGMYFAA